MNYEIVADGQVWFDPDGRRYYETQPEPEQLAAMLRGMGYRAYVRAAGDFAPQGGEDVLNHDTVREQTGTDA